MARNSVAVGSRNHTATSRAGSPRCSSSATPVSVSSGPWPAESSFATAPRRVGPGIGVSGIVVTQELGGRTGTS